MHYVLYVVMAFCIVCSGFFSAAEVAIVSVSRIGLRHALKEGRHGAKTLQKLKKDQRRTIVTILIGNNVVNISASSIAAAIAIDVYGDMGVGIATGIMTFTILILGEIIPKSFANANPVRFALVAAWPMYYVRLLLAPLVFFFDFFARLVSKSEGRPFSEKDIRAVVELGVEENVLEPQEGKLIERVLKFNDIPIRDIMVGPKRFISLDADSTIEEAAKIISRHEVTRFPVYSGPRKNIVGVVRTKDVLHEFSYDREGKKLKTIVVPPVYVHEGDLIDDVFRLFQKRHAHMGIVLDSREVVVGLVTLEDMLEEIVGEFESDSTREFTGHA